MTMTIAVDFDGVVHQYSRGWQDGTIYDPPLPGALDGLRALMEQHAVFIFTTREPVQVRKWLDQFGFFCTTHYDGPFWNERGILLITNQKLAATAYLDDRAVRFENWPQALAALADTAPTVLPATADRAVLERVHEYLEARLDQVAVDPADVLNILTGATEAPLSRFYSHEECGFHWHGRDGLDIPMRDGEPICPRCELERLTTAEVTP
jgi:hypothetical protein